MRLGFHYHLAALARDGEVRMPGFLAVFLEELARELGEVVVFAHRARSEDAALMDYRITEPRVRVVELAPRRRVPVRALAGRLWMEPIREWRERLDGMLIRGPTPLLPAIARAVGPTPTALLIVADNVTGLSKMAQPLWRKTLIGLLAWHNREMQVRLARRSLVFANSPEGCRYLEGRGIGVTEVRTSTIRHADFTYRQDTFGGPPPFRLLYAGRFERGKGLFELVESLALLVKSGEDLVLDLVGWAEPGDVIVQDLLARASTLGIEGRIRLCGYRSVGPDLFSLYAEADAFVLSSDNAYEGLPRVLWEAMANSLPIVSTDIGSIGETLGDAVTLVPPGSAGGLARGIRRLLRDPARRRSQIALGLKLARANTLEAQVKLIANKLRSDLVRVGR